jgi:transcriptional regulator with XRE-family HTH domain
MAGHPSDFDIEDQQILREEASRLMKEKGWTKTELGNVLGIKQQNVSRFINAIGGIRRRTANRLAHAIGFDDAEALISEGRFMRGLKSTAGNVWSARDSARRMAAAVGYPAEAIQAVVDRMSDPECAKKSTKWWLEQFMLEDMARRAG